MTLSAHHVSKTAGIKLMLLTLQHITYYIFTLLLKC